MNAIQTSLYLIAVALCIFSTAFTTRQARGAPLRYFTWFLIIQSANFAFELLAAHPATPLKGVWLGLLMASSLLVAPCLWLAFQETILGERPRLRALSKAHVAVITIGFLCTLPLIQDANTGTTFVNPAHPISHFHARFIHTTMLACIFVFALQVPWYIIRCRRMLLARIAARVDSQPVSRHWAHLPLLIVSTTWALVILRTVNCAFLKWTTDFALFVAVVSVGVTVGALYLLLRKFPAAEGAPAPDESAPQSGPGAQMHARAPSQYAKSPLPPAIRARIRTKLQATLARGEVIRDSALSLGKLSGELRESPHYVSQVINQELNTSFYELVNGWRVEEAKRLLRASPDDTVLAVALRVGFNSKSAFHTAFKRVTGLTPTAFRAGGQDGVSANWCPPA
jgi:AraC-like DNA-binding protein